MSIEEKTVILTAEPTKYARGVVVSDPGTGVMLIYKATA